MSNSKFRMLSIGYWLVAVCLFLYSYTQVDLNLTLGQFSIWQVIQKVFQYVGWFNRPLSTALYTVILVLLFTFYFLLLHHIQKGKINILQFWKIILPVSVILLFAYNAFSYDLFNYMFYGRIVTLHNENPYLLRALDFPNDPWINFMRWTHNTYPYGPIWLALSVPLSFIGMQFFLPTLFLYKSLMALSFLGTTYMIGRILGKIDPSKKLLGMAIFALNPLILIESLVSAHNDIVMIFLGVAAFAFLLERKHILGYTLLVLSIGIKFATALLSPLFLIVSLFSLLKKRIDEKTILILSIILMSIAVILSVIRSEIQPWYFIWILPFLSLFPKKETIAPVSIFSAGLLLTYVPFLYTGNWDPPAPSIKFSLALGSLILAFVVFLVLRKR